MVTNVGYNTSLITTAQAEEEILSHGETTPILLNTGTNIWRNTTPDEYLRDLRPWSKAFKVYREMQNDEVIGAMLEGIKSPIIASKFEIEAASESPEDQFYKEFINDNLLENPGFDWKHHVEEALEFLDLGFAIHEKVLEKRSDGRLYLKDLIPIGQETLYEWGPPDPYGRPTWFKQYTDYAGISVAPINKLLLFTFKGRKRNPMGDPLLRSLYRPWYFKKNLETIEAIGAERDVGNTPVVTLKEGINYPKETIEKLKEALEGFRVDENLYLILPGGATIIAYGGGNKVYDIRAIIKDWQHLIRQRFFADFLSLGSEGQGTQALAREMTTFFSLAEKSIQERMLWVWNNQLIRWVLRWNGYNPKHAPKLKWGEPGKHNLQTVAQALSTLAASELLDVENINVINYVLDTIGIRPQTPEEVQMKVQQRADEKEKENLAKTSALIGNNGPNSPGPNGDDNPNQGMKPNSTPWTATSGEDKEV